MLRFVRAQDINANNNDDQKQCIRYCGTQKDQKVGKYFHIVKNFVLTYFVANSLEDCYYKGEQYEDWK